MAIYMVSSPKLFIGLAADLKPLIMPGGTTHLNDALPAGSEFIELDTGSRFMWYPAGSTWYEVENILVSTS